MTHERDIERVLERWLTDGIDEMPDRVYQSILDRVDRQPQAVAPRLLRRLPVMGIPVRWIAAAAIVILIAVAGVAVVARPSESTVGRASPSPTGSPSHSPVPTVKPYSCLGGSACLGVLAPGPHSTTEILVPFSYTVPPGWENPADIAGSYMLQHQGSVAGSDDAIYVWPDPVVASQDPCTSTPEPGVGRTVDAIVAWLTEHPGVIASAPAPVTIGGLAGTMLDVRKDPSWISACSDGTVNLFVHEGTITDGFWWGIADGTRSRFVFLDAGSGRVGLISVEAVSADRWESFLAEAMPIVESFEFDAAP